MKGFLESVAEGYANKYRDTLSKVTFVMPNKRSGSFLLRELATYCGRPTLAPRIVTISDFVAEVSGLVTDHRLPSLFLLFDCYRNLSELGDIDFDKFSSWGETVLGDFNEVDMGMVDPDEIFKNVSDLNSIRTDFLTPEQKRVAERYFGYAYADLEKESVTFWRRFADIDETSGTVEMKKRFYSLWQVLRPLYRDFKLRLEEQGLTSAGGAFRKAAEMICAGYEPYRGEKIVMVGFNALTEAERRIFKGLSRMEVDLGDGPQRKVDFIWDPVSEFLAEEDDPAVRFVNYNMDEECFPAPRWIEPFLQESRPDEPPEVEVVSVPSNVMQVKVVRTRLMERLESIRSDVEDARVAVVLPDENLLLPLLYSLPENFPNPNLTMGYPLRHTPVVSFTGLLRRLQARVRNVKGYPEFFFEDVKDLLGHPYSHVLFGRGEIAAYVKRMEDEKRITVGEESTLSLGPEAPKVFRSLKDASAERVLQYISEILNDVRSRLVEDRDTFLRTKVESSFIDTFLQAVVLLGGCIQRYGTSVSPQAVFRLCERLIAGETVPFEGEPLKGLQVMGLLETRALDFHYVLMPSMNDKVMPRRGRNSSFIPNSLRLAYGLPPANYQEELFAYYFYRLAGRCRNLTLTYDARSSNNRSGGVSRYVLQLLYLADRITVSQREARFGIPQHKRETRSIEKSDAVMERLEMYYADRSLKEGEKPKNISASALNLYGKCQLKFLFKNVMGLYVEETPMETIAPPDLGNIVHEVMERLYITGHGRSGELLEQPVEITEPMLKGLLSRITPSGESLIEAEAKRAVNKYHFKLKEGNWENHDLRGSAVVVTEYIVKLVRSVICHDLKKVPFLLHGCEIKETYSYELPDGRKLNFKMVIDRLDEVKGRLRVVDYKTGGVHLKAKHLGEVFDGTSDASQVLQLVLYAMILEKMIARRENPLRIAGWQPEDVAANLEMVIYSIPKIRKIEMGRHDSSDKPEVCPNILKTEIKSLEQFMEVRDEYGNNFKDRLDKMLTEIMDASTSFLAEPTEERCRNCEYKLRCENL